MIFPANFLGVQSVESSHNVLFVSVTFMLRVLEVFFR